MLKIDNKLILSWGDIDNLIDKLCKEIPLELPLVDSVHGIARGGLTPAVMISHKLNLPYVSVVGKNTLVVDDIADSGVTLEKSPGVYTAVLHYKPHTSCFKPSIWANLHEGDEWVLYPWETKDSDPIQDYLNKDKDKFAHLADANYIGGLTMPKENTNKVGKNG
jgi:hypoxanthine phosphoribosyltransferase